MPRPADIVTLAGGLAAGAAVALASAGALEASLRLLFASYALDVLDGWVARRTGGGTSRGQTLDRALDRVSQVVAPLAVYASWLSAQNAAWTIIALFALYAGGLVAAAFWRLVYRPVPSLDYFSGLPMFVHAVVLLSSVLSGASVHPAVLLALLAASAAPIPYTRRLRGRGGPSPAPWPRLAVMLLLAAAPYDNGLVAELASLVRVAVLAYALAGWLPPALGLAPSPRRRATSE